MPNINQVKIAWDSPAEGPTACRNLRLRHTIKTTNELKERGEIENTDFYGPTLRNYAWFELTDTANGSIHTGVAASSGGSGGLHAERGAYHSAITKLLEARGVTELEMGGKGNNPLMWEAAQLTAKNIRITAAYTERSLCDECYAWLDARLSVALTVNYSFVYAADGRTIGKDEYRTHVKQWLEGELYENEMPDNLEWLKRYHNRYE